MNKRLDWLDCCKGATILLVVLGHVADGYLKAGAFLENTSILYMIFNLIYAFHMPLFFYMSGYVFYLAYCKKRYERKKNFEVQLLNLVWMYCLFSIVLWIFKMCFAGNVNKQFTFNDLILIPIKPLGEYWYLYVLIFGNGKLYFEKYVE